MYRLNDKDWDKQKKRINKFIKKWVRPIGLGWWKVNVDYDQENPECPREIGNCRVNWPYRLATITFNLSIVEDQTDEELETAVVHELMHIFVNEMREIKNHEEFSEGIKHEERVVTDLTNAMIWATKNINKKGAK